MTEQFRSLQVSRREFLVGAGAATFVVGLGISAGQVLAQLPTETGSLGVTNFVGIEPSGRITILYAKAEMGQGVLTGLPIILAEFMDANWDDVVIERAIGNNPGGTTIGGQGTVASNSTSGQWNPLRVAGLQVRAVLLDNAARQLGVPVGELTTEPSTVVHAASGRRLSYGQIVSAGATVPEMLPMITTADANAATPWGNFRLIGTEIDRAEVPSKTNGTAVFGIDIDLPGMLHGAYLRPPVQGESPDTVDDAAARAVPGVVEVVTTPFGVGVVAESLYAARRGVSALRVTWTNTAPARSFSSEQAMNDGRAMLAAEPLPESFNGAARVVSLDFRTNFVAHAALEPMTATVLCNEDGTFFEVWAGTQNPGNCINACRNASGVANNDDSVQVRVHVTLLGGGFGRRIESEHVTDAAFLARAVRGRPVKVVWTREDDLRFDPFRPLTVQRMDVALDAGNNIVASRNRILTQAYGGQQAWSTVTPVRETPPANDGIAAGGSSNPYGIATSQYTFMPTGIKVGAWRAIGASYQKWPIEAIIDEVADIRGQDPLAYRLELLEATIAANRIPDATNQQTNAANAAEQAARVLRIVAEMAGYDSYQAAPGRALGIGYSDALQSRTACIAEVTANRSTGSVRINRVWCAIDCGLAIMPRHVIADSVGSIIYAINPILYEYVPIVDGVPQVSNFFDYRMTRQLDAPQIEVRVVDRQGEGQGPTGVGEAATPPALPAIANAVRRALGGVHVGYHPLLPERVTAYVNGTDPAALTV